jgi:hypothetical protein
MEGVPDFDIGGSQKLVETEENSNNAIESS